MRKKIAIIGSDSYIATHFYKRSSDYDFRLFTYKSSGKEEEIIKDLFSISVEDFVDLDVIVNFAAIVHQPEPKDDTEFIRVNTFLPTHLARIAKEAGVKHFVQMSSLAVYGDVSMYEVDRVYNPEGVYGQTKLKADKALMELHDEQFKVTMVRPPIVYGGGLSPGNMQKLVRLALKGFPFPVRGLKNKRDVIHVFNLIDAIQLIIDNVLDGILLPTDRQTISTEDMVNVVELFSKKRIRKVSFPTLAKRIIAKVKPNLYHKLFGDARVVCNMPDIYQPKYNLKDGIEDIIRAIDEFKVR